MDEGGEGNPRDDANPTRAEPATATVRLRNLHHAAGELSAASTEQEAYDIAVRSADQLLAFDICEIFRFEDGELRLAASTAHETLPEEVYDVGDGLVGHTYREGRTTVVDDTHDHDVASPSKEAYRSAVSVPIADTAVLLVISTDVADFDRQDTEIVELLVSHVEAAIGRIDTERRLREQKRQVEQLHTVATQLESCHTHEALFDLVIEAASEVLGFKWCGVLTVEDGRFVATAVSDTAPVEVDDRLLSIEEGMAGWVYRHGEADYTDDTFEDDRSKPVDDAFRSALVVPIGDIGVLNAVSDERDAFGPEDVELAELLAGSVLEAYDRIEIQQQLRERQQELDLLKQIQSRVLRHNIRNDLSVIIGLAERLRDDPAADTEPLADRIIDKSEGLVATSEKARRMEQVLERRETTTIGLDSAVEAVVTVLRSEYPDAVVETDLARTRVDAHPNLGMAIENLIENGIVHNAGVPTVHVTVRAGEDLATCRIEDDGPGIPEHETVVLDRDRETELEHGSGAGLWLVRWIVDRSGGELDFLRTGDGTVVELRLPIAQAE